MFADKIGESCSTTGTGAFSMGGAYGAFRTWRSGFASGQTAFYLATNDLGTIWEIGFGTFTTGTPDTLSRTLIASSTGALVSWATTPYRVFSAPVGATLASLLSGGLGSALPAWAPAGFMRWDTTDGLATRWREYVNTAAGEKEIARYEVAEGLVVPSPRRPWTNAGAANLTATVAGSLGRVYSFDTALAARTLTLPLGSSAGHGFTLSAIGRSAAFGVVIAPDATNSIEGGTNGASLTILNGLMADITWDAVSSTWRISTRLGGGQIDEMNALLTHAYQKNGRRQVVISGPVTAAGLPSFLPATTGTLSITSQNVTAAAPLVVSAAGGPSIYGGLDQVGASIANLTWSGLAASATSYLYVDISADGVLTPGSTTIAPVYQFGGTYSTTNGAWTFNISEMTGKLGNGSTANVATRVYVGEVVTSGSGVTSTVGYAYGGRFESAFTPTLPGASTAVTASHNLGVKPRLFKFIAECTTTNVGYAVGDQVTEGIMSQSSSTAVSPHMFWSNTKSGGLVTLDGGSGSFIVASRSVPGSLIQLTAASWKYGWIADRGW
jgi:hypothetical protein